MEGKGNAVKRAAIKLVGFVLMLPMTAVAQEIQSATATAQEQGRPAPKMAVVYGFRNVTDLLMLSQGPVKETCSRSAFSSSIASANKTKPLTADEEAEVAGAVTEGLAQGLAKKVPVTYANPPQMPSAGSLVFTGCFVDMDAGSTAKRVVGMGLGASHLSAHVRVFYVGASGSVPVDEFDVAVKGSQKTPPLGAVGLALNAYSGKRTTLQADATRLADEILKTLENDHVF